NQSTPESAIMGRRTAEPKPSLGSSRAPGNRDPRSAPPLVWSFRILARALGLGGMVLVVAAIGLGRSAPSTLPPYHSAAVRFQSVNLRCTPEREAQPCFLDRQTGQVLRLEMPAGEILDYAACSPWCDERGQFQAVGRWMTRAGKQYSYLPQDFGLVRLS